MSNSSKVRATGGSQEEVKIIKIQTPIKKNWNAKLKM